jgi:hypothetical protein
MYYVDLHNTLYSSTGRGIGIILSLNFQQECIHSLIVVEK